MPEKNGKAKPVVNTEPSFFQRWFGDDTITPTMQQGIDIAKRENPNMAPVQPYGLFSRLLRPDAQAYTSPGRNIYVNPNQMKGLSPQDVADTLTHEQTHVGQMADRGFGPTRELLHTIFGESGPYGQRPDEIEAFQAEQARRMKMGRPSGPMPRFGSNEFYIPRDINLPPMKRR